MAVDFGGRACYAVLGRFAACARHVHALDLVAGIAPSGRALLDAAEIDCDERARARGQITA